MITRLIKIADPNESLDVIKQAADLIKKGETVAFPTETVYGLGANALNPRAVDKIFAAKGRPNDNPLIVHINEIDEVKPLVASISDEAYILMERFWPGPLTIIFNKSSVIPDKVTAGLSTVAIRMPRHPVAAALIRESGVPIAAPSANRSGKPSPTTAQHVYEDLDGRIPMILDGGHADVGLESTVLDMTGKRPIILRPGGITLEMLQTVLDEVELDPGILAPLQEGRRVRSPGMKYKHYAPNALVTIFQGELDKLSESIYNAAKDMLSEGKRVGIIATEETKHIYDELPVVVISIGSRSKPSELAANLFNCLRDFDKTDTDVILAEGVEMHDEGLAVMNRMVRAAGFNIVEVEAFCSEPS